MLVDAREAPDIISNGQILSMDMLKGFAQVSWDSKKHLFVKQLVCSDNKKRLKNTLHLHSLS